MKEHQNIVVVLSSHFFSSPVKAVDSCAETQKSSLTKEITKKRNSGQGSAHRLVYKPGARQFPKKQSLQSGLQKKEV